MTFAVFGEEPLPWAILASLFAIQVGFVLAGRNPGWMQDSLDQRERLRYSSGQPRDLDPSP